MAAYQHQQQYRSSYYTQPPLQEKLSEQHSNVGVQRRPTNERQDNSQYNYNRELPQPPGQQQQSVPRRTATRSSEATVSTLMSSSSSTGRESSATHVTEGPAYSKKIVVVGDGGCGKTCLLISYSQGYFPEKYVPTVFENYITYPTHPPTGKTVELALWDTAGQEEYDRLRPLSYPETDLILVCFAIDCPNSLDNVLDKWYPEVLHFCPYTPLILVGLKSDLRYKKTCIEMLKTQGLTPVTTEQGLAVATKMGAHYMECSSREMVGVDEIFEHAILTVVANDRRTLEAAAAAAATSTGSGMSSLPGIKVPKRKRRNCKIL